MEYELATTGVTAMALVQRQLDEGARCLTDCRSTTDACLLRMCWSASVARAMCPALEEARLGPFAR